MEKKFKLSLFIFRRDLRLQDNTGLIEALNNSEEVVCIFIFNPEQISKTNEYRSLNSMQFMKNSLFELDEQLSKYNSRLFMFYGKLEGVLLKLKNELNIQAIFFNQDYTPFAKKRDKKIFDFCQKENLECLSFQDALLKGPEYMVKDDGKPYTVFTPFYKKNSQKQIPTPRDNNFKNYYKNVIPFSLETFPKEFNECQNEKLKVQGGRIEAWKILKKKTTILKEYPAVRDVPSVDGTTTLSAHIKFGCVSVRELYEFFNLQFGEGNELVRQLFWRDFHYSIAYFFDYVFGRAFIKKYDDIVWENDENKFRAWKQGQTGFPIVDAGIRELNTTGYMHNRVRMIVASFLVKDLHIDWKWGEKYFATQLVDYDPVLNNGNWQWAASTGCDAQPYFRIFNPWLQQEKFDKHCHYIKNWVPELKSLEPKVIHNLYKPKPLTLEKYPKPIVVHKDEVEVTKNIFKNLVS